MCNKHCRVQQWHTEYQFSALNRSSFHNSSVPHNIQLPVQSNMLSSNCSLDVSDWASILEEMDYSKAKKQLLQLLQLLQVG